MKNVMTFVVAIAWFVLFPLTQMVGQTCTAEVVGVQDFSNLFLRRPVTNANKFKVLWPFDDKSL